MGYRDNRPLNPLHAMLLGFPLSLFTGALLSDYAYWFTREEHWLAFSLWLTVGGLAAGSLVLIWVLIGLVRAGAGRLRRSLLYFGALLTMCLLGSVNALVHENGMSATSPAWTILPPRSGH